MKKYIVRSLPALLVLGASQARATDALGDAITAGVGTASGYVTSFVAAAIAIPVVIFSYKKIARLLNGGS